MIFNSTMLSVNLLLRSILGCLLVVCHHSLVLSYQETQVQVADDVFLHTLEYGDSQSGTAPVVLFVHGFPDLSLSWQYHAQRLAEEGYFVVTPDLRGFGSSSMPKGGIAVYGRQHLISDLDALRKHYCGENGSFALIVGHDFGGTIVWATLDKFGLKGDSPIAHSAVIFNAPHPRIFFKHISKPAQAIKSWYMFFFQIPWLPEVFLYETKFLYHLTAIHYRSPPMKSMIPSIVNVEENLAIYKEALTDYDRIHAMLSYYRGIKSGLWRELGVDMSKLTMLERLIRWLHGIPPVDDDSCQEASADSDETKDDDIRITIPTLVLWGEKDFALSKELATPPPEIVEHNTVEYFDDAGHCVHWEQPLETAERLIRFANAHNGNNNGGSSSNATATV
mmetsp:Transcript_7404/g.17685  ORF Transcript_7404/g.17685 Transcript_7404/m.17685 type:complete len:392 (+) Transcript_7404:368-1543(+)